MNPKFKLKEKVYFIGNNLISNVGFGEISTIFYNVDEIVGNNLYNIKTIFDEYKNIKEENLFKDFKEIKMKWLKLTEDEYLVEINNDKVKRLNNIEDLNNCVEDIINWKKKQKKKSSEATQ